MLYISITFIPGCCKGSGNVCALDILHIYEGICIHQVIPEQMLAD